MLFVGTSIIHPSTEGVFLLCNILDLLIYSKELEIDRAWDEKTIRTYLKGIQKIWTQRQGATNDKEQLLLIDKVLKMIEDAYRFLTKAIKRQQYDQALELAYKAGKIRDVAEEKLQSGSLILIYRTG